MLCQIPGCRSAWLDRLLWEQEVVGSNPTSRTMNFLIVQRLEHLTLTQKIVVQIHVRKPVFLGSSVGMNGWLLTTMSQVRVLPEEPCTKPVEGLHDAS